MIRSIFLAICLLVLAIMPGSLFAIIDIFIKIEPSQKTEGYHTKVKLEKEKSGKVLVTLPKMKDSSLLAWLVVCKKARGDNAKNFRYEVYWLKSQAKSEDIEMVVPIHFGSDGVARIHLTEKLISRSYVVFGGFFNDGTFSTVDLPAFQKAMKEEKE